MKTVYYYTYNIILCFFLLKFLEDLIKSYDIYEKEDFKKIPPLGTHYSLRWAQKDNKDAKDFPTWSKSENDVDQINGSKDIDVIS